MKKALFLLLSAFIVFPSLAQAPFIQWQHSLGSSAADAAKAIERTADSGYIFAGITAANDGDVSGNHGGLDIWLVKLSSWGGVIWQRCLGGTAREDANAVKQTTDGGYIIVGSTRSADGDVTIANRGAQDLWVVKTDDTGGIQWQHSMGGSANDAAFGVQQTTDGGYIVVGLTESSDGDITGAHGGSDVWVIKFTAAGAVSWQKVYGGTDDDLGTAIQQTTDGGYIVAGTSASSDGDISGGHGGDDFLLLKLSSTGAIQWQKCYGGSGNEDNGDDQYPGTVQQTTDGGYIITGLTNSPDGDVSGYHGGAFFDYWVVKVSGTGSIDWAHTFGGTNDDDGYSVRQTSDGGYIVAGTSNSADGDVTGAISSFDYWILRLDAGGTIVWQKNYGGNLDEYPYCIRVTSDNEFIICGYSKSTTGDVTGNHGDYDAWVVKLGYCSLPASSAINGPNSLCAGSSIQLTDNTTGGTWTVSNGIATINNGLLTGTYGGRVAAIYTITNSCGMGGAIHTVTVNPLPTPTITVTGHVLGTNIPYASYQWTKNGAGIAGATASTYTYFVSPTTFTYSVTVTDVNGCTGTTGYLVHGVGVNDLYNNTTVTISPNPTSGAIHIEAPAIPHRIVICDLLGRQVAAATDTNDISIAAVPAGIYIIRLYDELNQPAWQARVVKE